MKKAVTTLFIRNRARLFENLFEAVPSKYSSLIKEVNSGSFKEEVVSPEMQARFQKTLNDILHGEAEEQKTISTYAKR
ncbi:MAG TPA: hypothetical protein VLG12_00550 [Candidatus Saccharimonadales bacterium]|nr:hypothetical protein [Candidatus Saccharimonadales bacterium]